jgi:Ca-activated chloride channel homolog
MNRSISNVQGWSLVCALLLVFAFQPIITASEPVEGEKMASEGGNKKDDEKNEDVIKIPIELVLLDVAVMDKAHRAVTSLNKNHFQIFEDKNPQKIEYFSRDSVPVSVGIVIDTSGSMRKKLAVVSEAAKLLVRLAKPGDEFFVVQFREEAKLISEFSCRTEEVEEALDELIANEGTAMLDAIYVSADYAFKEAKNRRKALLVVSDGDERSSFYKSEDLIKHIQALDVQVYIVAFPGDMVDAAGVFFTKYEEKASRLVNKIADESGGQAFFPTGLFDVKMIAEQIGHDIHSQYTIGYFSSNDKHDGSWRKVQVKLQDPKKEIVKNLSVRTRSGYFAPGQKQK